ncbi:hypothetical protein EK0264_05600 [Epidermidibacterium keratini]|uniref:Uncharacterized protein n=1 Tax=Epidermidibacterium keratini TaxID=1891644 RepID=A0A7L4YKT4_9ACTN|nr:hypothetical protein [Epidermidibacterium keratini]QHB99805.1 hypothetical protein EK0264_05600 [Epidermidibacterium keratini]
MAQRAAHEAPDGNESRRSVADILAGAEPPPPTLHHRQRPPEQPPEPARSSWVSIVIELVLVLVLGAALTFGFRLLWVASPYAAAIAAPLCLCLAIGVVLGVRMRRGAPSMPVGQLLLVVFVFALLVALPAAWALSR